MSEGTVPVPPPNLELTQDEKAYAGLAHALMISTWWIGPLVIFLMKRSSRFVSFHALQALLWQIIFTLLYIGGMVSLFGVMFATMAVRLQAFDVPTADYPHAREYMTTVLAAPPVAAWMDEARKLPPRETY